MFLNEDYKRTFRFKSLRNVCHFGMSLLEANAMAVVEIDKEAADVMPVHENTFRKRFTRSV